MRGKVEMNWMYKDLKFSNGSRKRDIYVYIIQKTELIRFCDWFDLVAKMKSKIILKF